MLKLDPTKYTKTSIPSLDCDLRIRNSKLYVLFEEIQNRKGFIDIQCIGKERYVLFRPTRNVETELIDDLVLADLQGRVDQAPKTALTVGCGFAYMENVLLELGVNPKNLIISDIQKYEVATRLFEPFEFHEFNMLGKWPEFGRKFDYIFIPDAFEVVFYYLSVGKISDWEKRMGRLERIHFELPPIAVPKRTSEYLGLVKQNSDILSMLQEGIEDIYPAEILNLQKQVLANALDLLNPNGQLRISGLLVNCALFHYLLSRLENQFTSVEFRAHLDIIVK